MRKDLYIIQSEFTGAIKIGVSKNVEKRISQMQTGAPYKLRAILILEGKGYLEKDLHFLLRDYRTTKKNKEWFLYESLSELPVWIYEQLDLEVVDNWWKKN
jgi:hypothetical protein